MQTIANKGAIQQESELSEATNPKNKENSASKENGQILLQFVATNLRNTENSQKENKERGVSRSTKSPVMSRMYSIILHITPILYPILYYSS